MAYLLDTHATVWAAGDPERLSPAAVDLLEDTATQLLVSAVVPWEIAIKTRQGKLPAGVAITAAWDRVMAGLLAEELPVTSRHALLAGSLEWAHRDPFDRILAAQCLAEGHTLITRDAVFGTLPGMITLW